ncbi:MAG: hypothetical protein KGZ92_07975 [Firmicutes bacterium]|nr:hypothetical protein [Dethiobacter sp.]MBS3889204.1 hypothetical protein [Bacillota bacterium]
MPLWDRAKKYCLSMTNEDIAGAVMIAALLCCVWILWFVGFLPPTASDQFYTLVYHMTYPLLLALPVSLVLALRTPNCLVLATPYLAPIAWNLFENFMYRRNGLTSLMSTRLFVATIIIYAVPFVLSRLVHKIRETEGAKAYRMVGAAQMLVLLGAVYYFTFQYGVQHLAAPLVSVQRLRFWAAPLSFPLVEADAAFIVDRRGRLFRIELASGRKRVIAEIPRPMPAAVGLDGRTLPRATREWSPFAAEEALTRIDHNTLNFRYRYLSPYIMHAKIDELTGELTWDLKEGSGAITPPPAHLSTVSRGAVISVLSGGRRGFDVQIQGENIKTAVDPLGLVDWKHSEHGWILVGTNCGELIIATTKGR